MGIKDLGSKIQQLRKSNNMSQQNLAEKLSVSNKTISKWECGNSTPDIEMLNKIANIFNISVDELIHEKNNESENNNTSDNIDDSILAESVKNVNDENTYKNSKNKKLIYILSAISMVFIIAFASLMCYLFIPRNPIVSESNLFSIDNNNSSLYCVVNNGDTTLKLDNEIQVPRTCKWGVFEDVNGTKEIETKTLNLNLGDNTFYLIVTNSSNKKKVYTLNVKRKFAYSLTFNSLGGTEIQMQTVSEGSYFNPDIPTKAGHIFKGWTFEGDIYDFNTTPINQNMNFVAEWEVITYTITYETYDSAIDNSINKTSYTVNTEDFSINSLSKKGYNFEGWYDNEDFTIANKVTEIKQGTTQNYNLYAKWDIIEYTITYVANGGEVGETSKTTYTINDKVTLEPAYYYGYQFINWYNHMELDVKGDVVTVINEGSTGNVTLYAKYTDEFDHEGYRRIDSTDKFLAYKNNELYFSDNARLYSNINLSESTKNDAWTPIGNYDYPFTAVFDGNGYKIQHFNPTGITKGLGLFAYTDGATIKNLSITYSSFDLTSNMITFGGLVFDLLNSTIDNCSVSIDANITVTSSFMTSLVIGGICNNVKNSTISNSYYFGNINVTESVMANLTIGGFTATMKDGKIINSYSTCSVNVISNRNAITYLGGLVGKMTSGEITNSFTTGNFKSSSTASKVGGLVGEMITGTITNSFATGDVYTVQSSETTYAGNLVGVNTMGGILTNCYGCEGQVVEGYTINSSEQKTFAELIEFTKENYDSNIWEFGDVEELPYLKKLPAITSVMLGYNPDDVEDYVYYRLSETHANMRLASIIEEFDTTLLQKDGYTFVGWYIYRLDLPWNPERNTTAGGRIGIDIIAKFQEKEVV